jgi:ferritin-like protein
MTHDKIFQNNFEAGEFEVDSNMSFEIESDFRGSMDEEDRIHYDMIAKEIHDLIQASRFKTFNDVDDLGRCNKLKKADINDIYGYITGEMIRKYGRIDIFSELCVYFDIKADKFYSSLANVYKEDLIQELDIRTGILNKKNIKKLF